MELQIDGKLKTWVYLRLRLHGQAMRALALTWTHFGRDQICPQVKASFSPFGYPTQVNASWMMSINLPVLLANETEDIVCLKCFFVACMYLRGNLWTCLAAQCKSLCKFNLCPLVTTYQSVWPGLKAFK